MGHMGGGLASDSYTETSLAFCADWRMLRNGPCGLTHTYMDLTPTTGGAKRRVAHVQTEGHSPSPCVTPALSAAWMQLRCFDCGVFCSN